MRLKPLSDRVVIKQIETEEKKYGSIIIPDSAKEKPHMGTVISVGTDEEVINNIQEGDTIFFAKYGGTEISVDNVDYIILSYSDILAIALQD